MDYRFGRANGYNAKHLGFYSYTLGLGLLYTFIHSPLFQLLLSLLSGDEPTSRDKGIGVKREELLGQVLKSYTAFKKEEPLGKAIKRLCREREAFV